MSVNFPEYLIAIVKSFMIFFCFFFRFYHSYHFLGNCQLTPHRRMLDFQYVACIKHPVSIMCSV